MHVSDAYLGILTILLTVSQRLFWLSFSASTCFVFRESCSDVCCFSHTQACSPLCLESVSPPSHCQNNQQVLIQNVLKVRTCRYLVVSSLYPLWFEPVSDLYPVCFQARPLTAVTNHTTAEGLMVVWKPVAAPPHLSDRPGSWLRGEGAHLRAAASAAIWIWQ